MTIQLTINQDEQYGFYLLYDPLSPLRKKIWKVVLWWVKRFPIASPSQSKIAETAQCSRSAVNEAFALFKKYGWLTLQSRGFKKSKILGIPIHLQCMDLVNRQYFKRIEATHRATHSYSNYRDIQVGTSSLTKRSLEIPLYLQKCKIPIEAKQKLSLVSEGVFQEAKYQCERMSKNGFIPDNPIQYFIETSFKIAKKRGDKIDWKKYYDLKKIA